MWNMNDIVELVYRSEYSFYIRFDDGVQGELSLEDYVGKGPVFEPLKDVSFFKNAIIEGGTISWPNGADIAPERLYERLSCIDVA